MSNGPGDDPMGGRDNIFYGGGVSSPGLSPIPFSMDSPGWNRGENLMRDDFDPFENPMFAGQGQGYPGSQYGSNMDYGMGSMYGSTGSTTSTGSSFGSESLGSSTSFSDQTEETMSYDDPSGFLYGSTGYGTSSGDPYSLDRQLSGGNFYPSSSSSSSSSSSMSQSSQTMNPVDMMGERTGFDDLTPRTPPPNYSDIQHPEAYKRTPRGSISTNRDEFGNNGRKGRQRMGSPQGGSLNYKPRSLYKTPELDQVTSTYHEEDTNIYDSQLEENVSPASGMSVPESAKGMKLGTPLQDFPEFLQPGEGGPQSFRQYPPDVESAKGIFQMEPVQNNTLRMFGGQSVSVNPVFMPSNLVTDVNMAIRVEYDTFVRAWDTTSKWITAFVAKATDPLDKGTYDSNDFHSGLLTLFAYAKKYLVPDGNHVGRVLMGHDTAQKPDYKTSQMMIEDYISRLQHLAGGIYPQEMDSRMLLKVDINERPLDGIGAVALMSTKEKITARGHIAAVLGILYQYAKSFVRNVAILINQVVNSPAIVEYQRNERQGGLNRSAVIASRILPREVMNYTQARAGELDNESKLFKSTERNRANLLAAFAAEDDNRRPVILKSLWDYLQIITQPWFGPVQDFRGDFMSITMIFKQLDMIMPRRRFVSPADGGKWVEHDAENLRRKKQYRSTRTQGELEEEERYVYSISRPGIGDGLTVGLKQRDHPGYLISKQGGSYQVMGQGGITGCKSGAGRSGCHRRQREESMSNTGGKGGSCVVNSAEEREREKMR